MAKPLLFPFTLFALLYAYRLFNAFAVTTLLFPDEWWQFGEPAHVVVYGYGYLTWDWRAGIRSYITIVPLMLLLQAAKTAGIGEAWMARNGSKLVMAGWMALTDLYTFKLAGRFFGPAIKPYALFFSILSGFHGSRSVRSLSNNVEMALSTVALFYVPIKAKAGRYELTLWLVGVACLVRVTAVLFWIAPLAAALRWISWRQRLLVTPGIVIAVIVLGVMVDSYFQGKLTVSWWNFYEWNIVKGVSKHFGRESSLYHLKVTLPLMINTQIGYFVVGLWRGWRSSGIVVTVGGVFLALCSVQAHKETRFLAPIYPLIVLYCAYGAQQLRVSTMKRGKVVKLAVYSGLIGVAVSQVLIGWFYGRVHFNGAYEIVDKLRGMEALKSVYFLTENHVTPGEGYLHRPDVRVGFLKCHPRRADNLMSERDSRERDEYARDEVQFVERRVIGEGYEAAVLYEKDLRRYRNLFEKNLWLECGRANNSFLAVHKRRGDLLIYCKPQNEKE